MLLTAKIHTVRACRHRGEHAAIKFTRISCSFYKQCRYRSIGYISKFLGVNSSDGRHAQFTIETTKYSNSTQSSSNNTEHVRADLP